MRLALVWGACIHPFTDADTAPLALGQLGTSVSQLDIAYPTCTMVISGQTKLSLRSSREAPIPLNPTGPRIMASFMRPRAGFCLKLLLGIAMSFQPHYTQYTMPDSGQGPPALDVTRWCINMPPPELPPSLLCHPAFPSPAFLGHLPIS